MTLFFLQENLFEDSYSDNEKEEHQQQQQKHEESVEVGELQAAKDKANVADLNVQETTETMSSPKQADINAADDEKSAAQQDETDDNLPQISYRLFSKPIDSFNVSFVSASFGLFSFCTLRCYFFNNIFFSPFSLAGIYHILNPIYRFSFIFLHLFSLLFIFLHFVLSPHFICTFNKKIAISHKTK